MKIYFVMNIYEKLKLCDMLNTCVFVSTSENRALILYSKKIILNFFCKGL